MFAPLKNGLRIDQQLSASWGWAMSVCHWPGPLSMPVTELSVLMSTKASWLIESREELHWPSRFKMDFQLRSGQKTGPHR